MNPMYDTILGEKCYKRLSDIPDKVEVVDCFRKSIEIPAIADEAIAIGAKVLWMQLGVENAEARAKAEAAGLRSDRESLHEDRARPVLRRGSAGQASTRK